MDKTRNSSLDNKEKQICLEINKKAANYFQKILFSESGTEARKHLENCQIKTQTIEIFLIGYASDCIDALTKYLIQEGYTKESLLKSGVSILTDSGKCIDRFQNRIMIPIIDVNDNIIGFSGRIVGKGTPTYINSPESVMFNHKQNLFSLQLAKHYRELILVEGYMDVIFLYQNGIKNAVASLGTPITHEQARLVATTADKVTICYDSDAVGVELTKCSLEAFCGLSVELRVLSLKNARDPYEYLKSNSTQKFVELLEHAESASEWESNR